MLRFLRYLENDGRVVGLFLLLWRFPLALVTWTYEYFAHPRALAKILSSVSGPGLEDASRDDIERVIEHELVLLARRAGKLCDVPEKELLENDDIDLLSAASEIVTAAINESKTRAHGPDWARCQELVVAISRLSKIHRIRNPEEYPRLIKDIKQLRLAALYTHAEH